MEKKEAVQLTDHLAQEQEEGLEQKKNKSLWTTLKGIRNKFRRVQVIPEEFRLEMHEIPLERYTPDASVGLTAAQVQRRIDRGDVNRAVDPPSKSSKEIVYSNIFTYFNLIFFIIAILLIVVGSFRDLTFLPVVAANTLIGIIQELRSKKVLDDLNILNAPRNVVIRDGKEVTVPSEEIVLDDIIEFGAGNQIPADAVVETGSVLVNESLITGEADQIEKKPGDQLLSGSFVVSGSCRARADRVGKDSYISQLTLQAKAMSDEEESEMIRALDRLVKIVGIVIIPIGLILFSQQYFINGISVRDSVTATVAAVIGMIPEGLYLLTSVALAVSVMRLAMQKVLVHNMKCIETLARVDVLCVDKTGTITDNTMTVKKVMTLRRTAEQPADGSAGQMNAAAAGQAAAEAAEQPADGSAGQMSAAAAGQAAAEAAVQSSGVSAGQMNAAAAGQAAETAGQTNTAAAGQAADDADPQSVSEAEREELASLELALGDFAAAMSADNITMKALKDYFRKRSGKRPDQVFSFSSETKYSGAVFDQEHYVLGAPEFILRGQYGEYREQIESCSRQGYRVLVFAKYCGQLDGKKLSAPVSPLGMILLANPVRENAKETFAYFAEQGVEIKVISGDNPVTVSEVAKEAGIQNAESYVDASLLLDEEELQEAAAQYTVFGRVSPEQKRQLVSALKAKGHTVAMTGDGVNDVLALKDADCSIAMASGSDAAAQVAQLVLLESDFSRMPSVVAEGRRVVNNIERTASLFLVKNIFSLLLSVFSIVLLMNYPLEPSQISLISMFTIGIPAFLMSQERNTDRIRGHFLSNVLFKALPGGLTDFIVVSALYIFCLEFNVDATDVSTSSTIILAIVGLMILYQIASPMTRFHWLIWGAMTAGLIYCMIFMRNIFAITSISKRCMMLLVLFALLTEPTFRYLSMWIRRLSAWYTKRRAERAAARRQ